MAQKPPDPMLECLSPEDRETVSEAAQKKNLTLAQYVAQCALESAQREFAQLPAHAPPSSKTMAGDMSAYDVRRQLEMLRAVASRTQNAVIVTDLRGTIEWVNEGFVRLTGYDHEEAFGIRPQDLLQGPDTSLQTRAVMAAAISRCEPFHVEVLNYDKSGRQYWVSIDAEPTFDLHGNHTGYFAIETDTTESRIAAASAEVTKSIGDRLLACTSVEAAARTITEELTNMLDVRAAQVWTVESAQAPLRYRAGTAAHPDGEDWIETTATRTFQKGSDWVVGVGAPGMAWGTGRSCARTDFWSMDQNGRFSRRAEAAKRAAIRTVCATPVHSSQGVVAVIEIGGSHNYPGHERLPSLLERVAQQFAAYLMQRKSLTEAEAANKELRRQIESRSAQLVAALSLSAREPYNAESLARGTEVNNQYRVEEKVGSGGMGAVYRVSRLSDGSHWAMKVATARDGHTLARLAREANMISRVRHANIVQVMDIDIAPQGFLYLILEFVQGLSLREWWQTQDRTSITTVVIVLRQILMGLSALHQANIAHRDLKPENVLISNSTGDIEVRLADFGISKLTENSGRVSSNDKVETSTLPLAFGQSWQTQTDYPTLETTHPRREGDDAAPIDLLPEESTRASMSLQGSRDTYTVLASKYRSVSGPIVSPNDVPAVDTDHEKNRTGGKISSLDLTRAGHLSGTPHYIAPELIVDESVKDLRIDLFSFGVLAFELMTGTRPFAKPIAFVLLERPLDPLPAPKELPADWSIFQPLLDRCLSFDPEERPTAQEALALLVRASTS